MRSEIKFYCMVVLALFCFLHFTGCGEKKDAHQNWVTEIAEEYIKALTDPKAGPMTREHACRALGNLKYPGAEEPLIDALKDDVPRVRFIAAWALGELGSRKGIVPLLQLLQDKDKGVRNAARKASEKIQNLYLHIRQSG